MPKKNVQVDFHELPGYSPERFGLFFIHFIRLATWFGFLLRRYSKILLGGFDLETDPGKASSSLRDLLVELSEVQQGAHGLSSSWRLVVEKTFQKRMTRPSVGMWNVLMIMNATPSHQVISIDASHIFYTWTRELGFAKRVWWWFLPKLFLEKRLQRNSKTLFRRQSPKTLTVLGVAWQKLNNTMQGGRLTEAAVFMLPSQNAITVERTVRSMVRCWTC